MSPTRTTSRRADCHRRRTGARGKLPPRRLSGTSGHGRGRRHAGQRALGFRPLSCGHGAVLPTCDPAVPAGRRQAGLPRPPAPPHSRNGGTI
jgi:hypothetical protein